MRTRMKGERTNEMMDFSSKVFIFLLIFFVVQVESMDPCQQNTQKLKCHPLTEICRRNNTCSPSNSTSCYFCVRKAFSQNSTSVNSTIDRSTYDDYYEYEDDDQQLENDEIDEKIDSNDYQDYVDDYVEPFDRSKPVRKVGICPKLVVDTVELCDENRPIQPTCRLDTDCPGDLKCCSSTCGQNTCTKPVQIPLNKCPKTFQCSLNCRLGYRVDSNGCLLCECQSCPSMSQCQKSCQSGYLKDLFNCDMCECRDECPPFVCRIVCPMNVGFAQSETGCPLCQCATSLTETLASNASCEKDVHCPAGFRCVTDAQHVPMCQAVSSDVVDCPPMKCPTGCETVIRDVNGCANCQCRTRQCSRVMCRMYCLHGFKRDEFGCEVCKCNETPQPCPSLACEQTCRKYRKDYSGCPTCDCDCPVHDCPQSLQCSNGLKVDADGCTTCTCNDKTSSLCPKTTCRMFCFNGFRRDENGCELCECDESSNAEKIQCSEKISCSSTKICNFKTNLCENVDPDLVNWFVYDFELSTSLTDEKFISTFTNALIHNIAKKYALSTGQITVSRVEPTGLTTFQIMPYTSDNTEEFQRKIDDIDADLNSHEFRVVLPAIADVIADDSNPSSPNVIERVRCRFHRFTIGRYRFVFYTIVLLLAVSFVVFATLIIKLIIKKTNYTKLDDRKSETSEKKDDEKPLVYEKRDSPNESV